MPTETDSRSSARDRIVMTVLGALAGFAAYALVELLPDYVENERLLLFTITLTGGFFAALLAAAGPLPYAKAILAAAISAVPAAALLTWASARYDDVEDFLETLHAPAAYALIVGISLPFLIAALRPDAGWRHYPTLFRESWNIVVRYAAAWLFTGVTWAVVFLSDALFGLVGLTIIQDLLDIEWIPFVVTGAVLGLALGVVTELADYVSPFLILRLLRLLLPVVLVVTAVFLIALPLRGLSNLFGGLSAAATLLAMALGIATLITSALDRADEDAADAVALRASAQLSALSIPVLAALALYAIWLRVMDYGLSPDRIAAACAAAVMLGYGVLYSLAVLARRNWMARIRGANIAMALVVVGLGALWLTPALNPERLTAQNQIARFKTGKVGADALDLWFIGRELGVAGPPAIDALAALKHPEAEALAARIARLGESNSRYRFTSAEDGVAAPDLIQRILSRAAVWPETETVSAEAFEDIALSRLRSMNTGCEMDTPNGRPGCVALIADFLPSAPGDELIMLWMTGSGRASIAVLTPAGHDGTRPRARFLSGSQLADLTPAAIDALQEDGAEIAPAGLLMLRLGGAEIIVAP
ncbi:MAG: DUF4153 domain-containing protein [Rhodobacter sp.]|nr:DUF4153 domain-containing protein [Rhodobacter sp.]